MIRDIHSSEVYNSLKEKRRKKSHHSEKLFEKIEISSVRKLRDEFSLSVF
jgi:hypothetical protein